MKNDDIKKVDGIKKLSKEEIAKHRHDLLDYIGEPEKAVAPKVTLPKRVDGIKTAKKKVEKISKEELEARRKELKKSMGEEKPVKSDFFAAALNKLGGLQRSSKKNSEKADLVDKNLKEDIKLFKNEQEEAKRIEDNKKKERINIRNKKDKKQLEKKSNDERLRLKRRKIKMKKLEDKKTLEENAQKKQKRLQKIKKEEEEKKKIKKEEDRLKKINEKRKKKIERRKKIRHKAKNFKFKSISKFKNAYAAFNLKKKRFLMLLLIIAISVVLFYLLMVLSIVKLNLDNFLFRKINSKLPIPALITDLGIIDYYEFADAKIEFAGNIGSEEEINSKLSFVLVKNLILRSIAEKNGLIKEDGSFSYDEVANAARYDRQVNQVGINRIEKIKALIKDKNEFKKASTKYGDKLSKIDFATEKDAINKYGERVGNLKVGDVSNIVYGDDGYYIFKRYEKADMYALSYVFVYPKKLDDYLSEKSSELKIWSLVE